MVLCLLKLSKELHFIINSKSKISKENFICLEHATFIPNLNMVNLAFKDLVDYSKLLKKILIKFEELENGTCNNTFSDLIKHYHLKLENKSIQNYVQILEFCGIVNVSQRRYRSKILSRFQNMKDLASKCKFYKITQKDFIKEVNNQLDYINTQIETIKRFNLKKENIILFAILFDISPPKSLASFLK